MSRSSYVALQQQKPADEIFNGVPQKTVGAPVYAPTLSSMILFGGAHPGERMQFLPSPFRSNFNNWSRLFVNQNELFNNFLGELNCSGMVRLRIPAHPGLSRLLPSFRSIA
jgi:hypothetical protein